jgi:hypothetical protein
MYFVRRVFMVIAYRDKKVVEVSLCVFRAPYDIKLLVKIN